MAGKAKKISIKSWFRRFGVQISMFYLAAGLMNLIPWPKAREEYPLQKMPQRLIYLRQIHLLPV